MAQQSRSQMEGDEHTIRQLHSTWINAVNAADLALLLTLVTDDVVFMTPGQRPLGRDGFASNFTMAHENLRIHCTSVLEEVVVVGDVAYARSNDALSVSSRSVGATTELRGHRLTIYRKQGDGRWLLARDAHTLSAH